MLANLKLIRTNNFHEVYKNDTISQAPSQVGDQWCAWLSLEVVVDPGSVVLQLLSLGVGSVCVCVCITACQSAHCIIAVASIISTGQLPQCLAITSQLSVFIYVGVAFLQSSRVFTMNGRCRCGHGELIILIPSSPGFLQAVS